MKRSPCTRSQPENLCGRPAAPGRVGRGLLQAPVSGRDVPVQAVPEGDPLAGCLRRLSRAPRGQEEVQARSPSRRRRSRIEARLRLERRPPPGGGQARPDPKLERRSHVSHDLRIDRNREDRTRRLHFPGLDRVGKAGAVFVLAPVARRVLVDGRGGVVPPPCSADDQISRAPPGRRTRAREGHRLRERQAPAADRGSRRSQTADSVHQQPSTDLEGGGVRRGRARIPNRLSPRGRDGRRMAG